ncbi:hypothetical protein ALC57_11775, partial [Trachymyrmex cornetzi]
PSITQSSITTSHRHRCRSRQPNDDSKVATLNNADICPVNHYGTLYPVCNSRDHINIRVDTHQNQTDFACLSRYTTMEPKLITAEITKGNEEELLEFQG